jgi:DNA-binding transcriptional regulator YhcF (GntR family)
MQIIENKRGIGYFVNPEAPRIILENKRQEFFEKILPEFVRHAEVLGIPSNDLKKHIENFNSAK